LPTMNLEQGRFSPSLDLGTFRFREWKTPLPSAIGSR
jgi:hypothetical protein